MTADHPRSLYVHVPFCRHICAYCDFCRTVYRKEEADRYLDVLEQELCIRDPAHDLDTVYIGGGTPTSLDHTQLERLLRLLEPYTHSVKEYTIEINPETLDEEKAGLLRRYGINRASVGMQSSDPALLKLMNRMHTFEDVQQCVHLLRKNGIDNVSLDLMYSLPGQTMTVLEQSLNDALSLEPQHLSLYSLTIEENSVFGKLGYDHLDEETEADMYEYICRRLKERGYEHYEISNFALPGKRSMHNTVYWEYRDFYGAGCGASGKEGNTRYDITRNLKEYVKDPLKREDTVLSEADLMFETIMMSLRMKEGLDKHLFYERFRRSADDVWPDQIRTMCRRGLLVNTEERLFCTEKGMELLNEILVEFIA